MINKVHFFLIGCIVVILFYSFNKKEHAGVPRPPGNTIYQGAYLPGHQGIGKKTPYDCKMACSGDTDCIGVDIASNNIWFDEKTTPRWCGKLLKSDHKDQTIKLVTNDKKNSDTFTTWINPKYANFVDYMPIPVLTPKQLHSRAYLEDHKVLKDSSGKEIPQTALECYYACQNDTDCLGADIYAPNFDFHDNGKRWCGMFKKADLGIKAPYIKLINDASAKDFSSYIKDPNAKLIFSKGLTGYKDQHKYDIDPISGIRNNEYIKIEANYPNCKAACYKDDKCHSISWHNKENVCYLIYNNARLERCKPWQTAFGSTSSNCYNNDVDGYNNSHLWSSENLKNIK